MDEICGSLCHLDRPTVVCLHCWCGGCLRLEERIFAARRLYDEGFDVVVVTFPFHGERAPTDAVFSGQFFPSPDLRRTNELGSAHRLRIRQVFVAGLIERSREMSMWNRVLSSSQGPSASSEQTLLLMVTAMSQPREVISRAPEQWYAVD